MMIQGDQENTSQAPLPLGLFVQIMGWLGQISLVLIGIGVLYELLWYGACLYAIIIIVSIFIMFPLLEKLNLSPTRQRAVLHHWKVEESTETLVCQLAKIPLALIGIVSGLYVVLTFISALYQLLLRAPLLLVMSLIVTPIIISILDWLLGLKFWNK